ncbi:hypothetical protein GWI33_008300 [Rhynchophorus ferrugineus]|uniref:C2H2-type domain-containing protein n=1 Tax=Rhynchophorus ferrugineus TaxID=354439 RepID=A0A834IVR1_RHYFE|nr:hypothetical protein GWI33_008300 [Rhynchophorus ferrugineus]
MACDNVCTIGSSIDPAGNNNICSRKVNRKCELIESKTKKLICMICSKEIPMVGLDQHESAHRGEQKLQDKEQITLESPKEDDAMCTRFGVIVPLGDLPKHEKKNHRGMKARACTICGRTFKNVYSHMTTHSNERRYSCKQCGNMFKQSKHLRKHELVHMSVGKHNCPTCGKSFKCPSNLKAHTRIHQVVKPFACQHCKRTFTSKRGREVHLQAHINSSKPHFLADFN